jgi:hypothetical protein
VIKAFPLFLFFFDHPLTTEIIFDVSLSFQSQCMLASSSNYPLGKREGENESRMSTDVAKVDDLSRQMYAGASAEIRQAAEAELRRIAVDAGAQLFLDVLSTSTEKFSITFITQALVTWFRTNEKRLPLEVQDSIVKSVLTSGRRLIANSAPKFLLSAVVNCCSKLVKLGFEKEPFLSSVVDTALLLTQESGSPVDVQLGFFFLSSLVSEFCLYDSSRASTFLNFAAHRRCSNNFRDTSLLSIFVCAVNHLRSVNSGEYPFVQEITLLVRGCLTYDFMAIISDETEETLSSQFPSSWRDVLFNSDCQAVLWTQQKNLPYPHNVTVLTGLCSICGLRRSFFDTAEDKISFLQNIFASVTDIFSATDDRFSNQHYCSQLAECFLRFVSPYGYKDMSSAPGFDAWLQAAAQFTLSTFQVPFGEFNSFVTTTTLLNFWSRLTNSKRVYYSEEERRRDLEVLVPALCEAFFRSRTTPIDSMDCEDDIAETISTQADAFPLMVLMDIPTTMGLIVAHLQRVGALVCSSSISLAWVLQLAGSIVRTVFQNIDETHVDICSVFLRFAVDCSTNQINASGREYNEVVESALLHFLTNVQLVFTGSRINAPLTKIVTNVFSDRSQLFQFILQSVGHNIVRGDVTGDTVTAARQAIDLISEACRDVSPNVLKDVSFQLPPVVSLPMAQSFTSYKLRTNLYSALWQLKAFEAYTTEQFLQYVQQIEPLMLQTMQGVHTESLFIAGWLRDLRGACRALCSTQSSFTDFVDWVIDHGNVFVYISQNSSEYHVVISLLRFVSELVTASRMGKVNLPTSCHSPSGVLLFKFVCNIVQAILGVCITNEKIAQVQQGHQVDGAYQMMLKPLLLCMEAMRKCIHGDFVPFGAMTYYSDSSFDDTVGGLFRLLTVFPVCFFTQYKKVGFAAMDLLRSMTEGQVFTPLASMSGGEIVALINLTVTICNESDTQTSTLLYGMSFLSFIAGLIQLVKRVVQEASGTPSMRPAQPLKAQSRSSQRIKENIARSIAPHSAIWSSMISCAMEVITNQDRALSVASQVVFPIFEAEPSFWFEFTQGFLQGYPEGKRHAVNEALGVLANAAESQEKFFSEVFVFRTRIRAV